MTDNDKMRQTEAEFREYARNNLLSNDEESVVRDWAGEVEDPQVRTYLDHVMRVCSRDENMDRLGIRDPSELKLVQDVRTRYATESASEALLRGRRGHLSFFSGLVNYQQDVSGMQSLMELQQLVRDTPVFISYIYGIMGSGKTDFSNLLREVFRSVYGEDGVEEYANFKSEGLTDEIYSYQRVVDDLAERRERIQDGEDLDPYLLIIDEAAQLFTGSGADQKRSKQLAKLLKLARKSRAHIILIGQDGKDIGPALRTLCTVFIHKDSQKQCTLYRDVKDRTGKGEMMSLSGVPETSISYDTYDEGRFEFDDEEDTVDEEVLERELEELEDEMNKKMAAYLDAADDVDMTQAEIAELYDTSPRTIQRAKQTYSEELEQVGLM